MLLIIGLLGRNGFYGCYIVDIYWDARYWAVCELFYANRVVIYSGNTLFIKKSIGGIAFGWLLIPIAIKKIIMK